jgi:hypothetical protein
VSYDLDLDEQENVRRGLKLYCKAHGIGVPTLAKRITDADPQKIRVSVKTLQRFLAGERIREVAALNAYARFSDRTQDPLTALGTALCRLQGTDTKDDISGSYILLRGNAECPVTITKQADFWRMTVRDRDAARIYEGVVINTMGVFVAHLKDRVFGLPRHYHFTQPARGFFCDADNADKMVMRPDELGARSLP